MRVLITSDINYEFVCGSNRFLKNLAHWLKENGHEVLVVVPSGSGHEHSYESEGISVFGVGSIPSFVQDTLRVSLFSLVFRRPLKKILKKFKPDLIHIHSHFLLPFSMVQLAHKKYTLVGTNHFVPENVLPAMNIPGFIIRVLEPLVWKHLHWVFGKMDKVTTPTHTAADILRRSGFRKPIHVISNGIDLKRFEPHKKDADRVQKKYHLPNKKILLFVGRLDPEKHIEVVLRALPSVLKKIDLHFVVAGRGAEAKTLEKLTAELGLEKSVTFTGYVPEEDLPGLYQTADCFVNAGTAELQCIAMLEAMATGLPVIAADAMALHELVMEGENGFLFTPDDADELAQRILTVFSRESDRLHMGQKSRELAAPHDIQKVMLAFEALYKQAWKKRHKGAIK